MLPFQGDGGNRFAGVPSIKLTSVAGRPTGAVSSSSSESGAGLFASEGGFAPPEGSLMGTFFSWGTGGFSSIPSSSSDSDRFMASWLIFRGLSGIGFSFSACGAAFAADRVPRPARPAAETALRTGFPRSPVVAAGADALAGGLAVAAVVGATFSFSGSSNLTVFLTAGFARDRVLGFVAAVGAAAVVLVVAEAAGRPRVVVFLTGAGSGFSACSVAVFLVRVALVGFTGRSTMGSATFLGLPRVRTVAAGAASGSGSGSGSGSFSATATFFGRPRPRVGFAAIAGIFAAGSSWSSSSPSSARVFRFVAVLVVVVVAVAAAVVLRAGLAFTAAVAMRAGLVVAGSDAFAAALARVILFGGDCGPMFASLFSCRALVRR